MTWIVVLKAVDDGNERMLVGQYNEKYVKKDKFNILKTVIAVMKFLLL